MHICNVIVILLVLFITDFAISYCRSCETRNLDKIETGFLFCSNDGKKMSNEIIDTMLHELLEDIAHARERKCYVLNFRTSKQD
jgi:hypothetical protein